MRHFLTFFGLLSDLLGATLLSIPMIWDTREAARILLKFLKFIRFFLYGPPIRRKNLSKFGENLQEIQDSHERLLSVGMTLMIYFLVIGIRLVIIVYKNPENALFQTLTAYGMVDEAIYFLMVLVSIIFMLLILYFVARFPFYLARKLLWVARGNHERKIGFVGLGLLCVGFILQAAVNLI